MRRLLCPRPAGVSTDQKRNAQFRSKNAHTYGIKQLFLAVQTLIIVVLDSERSEEATDFTKMFVFSCQCVTCSSQEIAPIFTYKYIFPVENITTLVHFTNNFFQNVQYLKVIFKKQKKKKIRKTR